MAAENASENPVGLLLDAINFSAIKHSTQRRKDAEKTPYINHPIGVAHILWKEGDVTDLATLQVTMTIETGRGLNIARLGFSLVSSVLKDIYIWDGPEYILGLSFTHYPSHFNLQQCMYVGQFLFSKPSVIRR